MPKLIFGTKEQFYREFICLMDLEKFQFFAVCSFSLQMFQVFSVSIQFLNGCSKGGGIHVLQSSLV